MLYILLLIYYILQVHYYIIIIIIIIILYTSIFNSYSSRTRRICADIYNQRGRRPSWISPAHIRQVREE